MKLIKDRQICTEEMEDTVTGRLAEERRPRAQLPENSEEYDSFARSLSTLRRRFEGRGMVHTVLRDAKRQTVAAMSTRAMAPGAYADYGVRVSVSDRFRTGECNGERYMTNEDFVRYYAEHRRNARPDADLGNMAVTRDGTRKVPVPKPKKPFLAPADERDRKFVGKFVSKLPASVIEKHPEIGERAAEVHKWLRADTIHDAPASGKRKFPISVASAILVMTISLSLIVGGTVMQSDANAQYREAVNALEAVEAEERNLERQLAVKLDLAEIEDYARNTLGMVDQAYAEGVYLDNTKTESIEVYEEEAPSFGLSTLLSVFGFGG